MAGVLQQPALLRLGAADKLHAVAIMAIGVRLALVLPPGVVGGGRMHAAQDVGDERLPQQHAAFVHFLRDHLMRRALLRGGGIARLQHGDALLELRIAAPRLDRGTGHRAVEQPGLEALEARIDRHQPVQGGGAGARHAGDDDRADDRLRVEARVFLHRLHRLGAAAQDADDLAPGDAAAQLGEAGIVVHRLEQDRQARQVVVRAEIVGADLSRHDGVDLVERGAELCGRIVAEFHLILPCLSCP